MRRPPVRIAVLAVAAVTAIVAAMLHYKLDAQAEGLQVTLVSIGSDSASQSRELVSIRASLLSMSAPGQAVAQWSDSIAKSVATLRSQRDSAGAIDPVVAEAITKGLDRLVALSRRIGDLAMDGQDLMASDLLFSEATPLVNQLNSAFLVLTTRRSDATRHAIADVRQQQRLLAAVATSVALIAALLLFPGAIAAQAAAPAPAEEGLQDLRRGLAASDERFGLRRPAPAPLPVATPAPERQLSTAAPVPAELAEAAAICGELARVTDASQLTALLGRAAGLLGASGVIVWMADTSGTQLFAAAWHGYESRLFERIGPIRREAANLTAAAFRELTLRSTPAVPGSAAALAVPLPTVDGAVGVLSAELRSDVAVVPPATASLATILAAQLATLVTPRDRDASSAEPSIR